MSSRSVSLGIVWIAPFVLLISLSVGLVGYLSLYNSEQAVNALADQLIERTNQLVVQHLESYLLVPQQLVQLNAASIEQGSLDWQNFAAIGDYFWQQATLYDLAWINYGLTTGEYAGAGEDNGMFIGELSPATGMQYIDFHTGPQGKRISAKPDPSYDFRNEAWYQDAMHNRRLTWSEIYLWEGTNQVISSTMALGIAQPIYRGQSEPVGAIGIDLSLTKISDFLRSLQITPSARLFIVENDGMVIATSSDEAPFEQIDQQLTRLAINHSRDPLIRATADYLLSQVGSFDQIQHSIDFSFELDGKRQFACATPWHDQHGLSWLVVMVVNESDFMGQIQANLVQTIWLSLAALAAALGVGFYTARLITGPMAALKVGAQQIAAGQLEQQLTPSGIREVDSVGHSFNQMATQLQDSFNKLTYLATHDLLTGLPNRAAFRHFLTEAIQRHEQRYAQQLAQHSTPIVPCCFAILFLDLDGFKLLNDSLGHLAGDQLLVEVSKRLQRSINGRGHVARFGGDEFVILLDQITQPSAIIEVVEQIGSTIRQPFLWHDSSTVISTSIGVAFNTNYATDADSLLRNADIALYQAKANGKATYAIFDDAMHVAVMERLQLESDLRHALARNELSVHYQPIVDTNSLEMAGVEALMRWHHPTLGMVSPVKFIPIAEETGLIIPLGWWVLRTACQQLREWQTHFVAPPKVVNVNLSTRQLLHHDLINQVRQILCETGLPPHSLKLEITESLLINERLGMQSRLTELKALGVQLSLDDFGTGYSGLSYLHQFPLDTLKIDRSFVQQMDGDRQRRAIIEAIVDMAHRLGLDVIVEGVETQAELDYLRTHVHCEQIQGYLISPAVPPAAIQQWISHSSLLALFTIEEISFVQ